MDSEMERMSIQRRRAGNAVIAVVAFVVVVMAGCVLSAEAKAESANNALAGHVWEELRRSGSVADAFQEIGLEAVSVDEVPEWFLSEIMQPKQGWDIWAIEDWSVVGIGCSSVDGELQTHTKDELKRNGWSECPSGVEGVSTYVKDGGICKWAMLEFVQMGESESMVLRILRD